MSNVGIIGTGSYVPKRILKNRDAAGLNGPVDWFASKAALARVDN